MSEHDKQLPIPGSPQQKKWGASGSARFIARLSLSLFALLLCCLAPQAGFSQSKKELEDRRKKIIRDIEATDKMLRKTTQSKEAAYDRFVALQNQIRQRENLVRTLHSEISAADASLERTSAVINSLESDVQRMRAEYGRMVRSAYRRKMLGNPLLYILSAESLNQAFRRWIFLRKYDRRRKEQAEAIAATQSILSRKMAAVEEARREKENLLASIQGQQTTLSTERDEKDNLLKSLSKDENRLRSDLQKKQEAHEALNRAIENIIQQEVQKQVELSRKQSQAPPSAPSKKPAANPPPVAANPESAPEATEVIAEDNTSRAFRLSQGRLPWPVENGFVSRGYGRQKHPTLKNIEITNNGVDIRTGEGSGVRAIYEGKVAGVQFIPGHDYTVILQHGNYYTVYSNLSETSLQKGDWVKAKQVIGRVSTNAITGASELHFELWRQKERLNPSLWIRK